MKLPFKPLNEVFYQDGARLQVTEQPDHSCVGCYYFKQDGRVQCDRLHECIWRNREDRKSVIFKQLK